MAFTLAPLPYDFDALEPHIDARTMEIHHDKHHAAYTNNLNAAIEGTALEGKSIEEILMHVSNHSPAVRNNGGGYFNHNLFWEVMSPSGGGEPTGDLAKEIENTGAVASLPAHMIPQIISASDRVINLIEMALKYLDEYEKKKRVS